jgi:hypothetical protein
MRCSSVQGKPQTQSDGAEASSFTAKRHQFFMMTGFATYPQEPVFQTAALQVSGEFLLHIVRQIPTLSGKLGQKRRVVFFHNLIEKCLLGLMADIPERRFMTTCPGCCLLSDN